MSYATLLVDHSNILHSRTTISDVITAWLKEILLSGSEHPPLSDIIVRAYGGWNDQGYDSDERFDALTYYQSKLESLITLDGLYFRIRFSIADRLLGASDIHRFEYTVGLRATPDYFLINDAVCKEPDCQLPSIRRWIRKRRACTKKDCPNSFGEIFSRRQQKQVDTHLAVDLLHAMSSQHKSKHIGIVTADLDLVPALFSSLASKSANKFLYLLKPKPYSFYCDHDLLNSGARIIQP